MWTETQNWLRMGPVRGEGRAQLMETSVLRPESPGRAECWSRSGGLEQGTWSSVHGACRPAWGPAASSRCGDKAVGGEELVMVRRTGTLKILHLVPGTCVRVLRGSPPCHAQAMPPHTWVPQTNLRSPPTALPASLISLPPSLGCPRPGSLPSLFPLPRLACMSVTCFFTSSNHTVRHGLLPSPSLGPTLCFPPTLVSLSPP